MNINSASEHESSRNLVVRRAISGTVRAAVLIALAAGAPVASAAEPPAKNDDRPAMRFSTEPTAVTGYGVPSRSRVGVVYGKDLPPEIAQPQNRGGGSWHGAGTADEDHRNDHRGHRGHRGYRDWNKPIVRNTNSTTYFNNFHGYDTQSGHVVVVGGSTINGFYNRFGFGYGPGHYSGLGYAGSSPYGSYYWGDGYYPSNPGSFGGGAYYFVPGESPRDWAGPDANPEPEPEPLPALDRARWAFDAGEGEIAAALYREHLEKFPEDWAVLREAAIVMAMEGDLTVAAASMRYALVQNPELADAPTGEGRGWKAGTLNDIVRRAGRAGERSGAASDWLLALEAERAMPKPRPEMLDLLLTRARDAGLEPELVDRLTVAIEGDPVGNGETNGG